MGGASILTHCPDHITVYLVSLTSYASQNGKKQANKQTKCEWDFKYVKVLAHQLKSDIKRLGTCIGCTPTFCHMVVVLGLGLSSYRKCSLEVVAARYRVCHVIFLYSLHFK